MNVLKAIKYLQENYEEIDPSYLQAPLLSELMPEPAEEIQKFVMAPELEHGPEERSPQEWEKLVEAELVPAEAAKLIIEWIRSRVHGQQDNEAMQEYLASPPDQRQYVSPTSRT
jgi:hypothetical protein